MVGILWACNRGIGLTVVQSPLNDQSVGFRGTNLGVLGMLRISTNATITLQRRFTYDLDAWKASFVDPAQQPGFTAPRLATLATAPGTLNCLVAGRCSLRPPTSPRPGGGSHDVADEADTDGGGTSVCHPRRRWMRRRCWSLRRLHCWRRGSPGGGACGRGRAARRRRRRRRQRELRGWRQRRG
jgi:hypothetical protein